MRMEKINRLTSDFKRFSRKGVESCVCRSGRGAKFELDLCSILVVYREGGSIIVSCFRVKLVLLELM